MLPISGSSSVIYSTSNNNGKPITLHHSQSSNSGSRDGRKSRAAFADLLRASSVDVFSLHSHRASGGTGAGGGGSGGNGNGNGRWREQGLSLDDPCAEETLALAFEYLKTHLSAERSDVWAAPVDPSQFDAFSDAVAADPLAAFINADAAALPLVAALVKVVLSHTPQPLLISDGLALEQWAACLQISDDAFQRFSLRSAVFSLPPLQRSCAARLFSVLGETCAGDTKAILNAAFGLGPVLLHDGKAQPAFGGVVRTSLADYYRLAELLIRKRASAFASSDLPYGFDQSGLLANASLHRTIDFLLDPIYCSFDPQFVDTVLLTHPYFICSEDLLGRLSDVFASVLSDSPWHTRLRKDILRLVRQWLEEYAPDLERESLSFLARCSTLLDLSSKTSSDAPVPEQPDLSASLHEADSFTARCHARGLSPPVPAEHLLDFKADGGTLDPSVPFIRVYCLRLLELKKNKGARLVRNISYFYRKKQMDLTNRGPDSSSLLGMLLSSDASDIAQSLTLIDHGLFKAIPSREFLKCNFQNDRQAPQFAAMTTRFNLIGNWIVNQIVSLPDLSQRCATLSFAIDIASNCFDLRNFNTCFAILAGLGSASISRLRHTWDSLGKKVSSQYKKLLNTFEMSNNFTAYRTAYASAALPKVPYLMLFTKDLIAIEDNNPTLLSSSPSSSSSDQSTLATINFQKMRLLWNVFSDIRKTQQAVYPFPPNPTLHVFLSQLPQFPEDELWKRSLLVEPRE
ncbi:MAG: guanine nucleotide exchange factor [archaeon]|nr:guanine nucleotide exchange factor [archaeon]